MARQPARREFKLGDAVAKRVDNILDELRRSSQVSEGAAAGAAGAASAIVAGSRLGAADHAGRHPPQRRSANGSRRARRFRPSRAARRRTVHSASGLGSHGRRLQSARLRLRGRESRLGLRGHARVPDQSRRQPQARDSDGIARGSRRGHRARLRQGRRQADDDAHARHGRPAACVDGPVPSLVRPRSRVRCRRPRPQPDERRQSAAQRARHGRDRARLHEDGRRADEPRRIREHRDARVHDRPHAADGPHAARRRLGAPGRSRCRSEQAHRCRVWSMPSFPQGDSGAVREAARLLATRRAAVDPHGQARAHVGRLGPTHRARGIVAGARRRRAGTPRGKTSLRGTRCTARAAPTIDPTSSSASSSTI